MLALHDVTVDDRDHRILCKYGSDFLHPVVVDLAVIIGHRHDVGPGVRQPELACSFSSIDRTVGTIEPPRFLQHTRH
jgi:hypothetical protein